MSKLTRNYILLFVIISFANNLFAQEKDTSRINIAADFVSRYIWRGMDYGKAPSIQPTFSFIKGGFEIGTFGAFNTIGSYHELDIYAKFSVKNFSVICSDYFIHNETDPNNTKYFDFEGETTNHALEGALQYKGGEKFPLSILVASYFYGNDRKVEVDSVGPGNISTTISQNYSTYLELGYAVKCRNKTFDLFVGLTPLAGAYGNTFGVINAGITGYRTIQITDRFGLPVKATVIANPQARNLYFVLGITL